MRAKGLCVCVWQGVYGDSESFSLYFAMSDNFRLYLGHCGWYVLETLDSMILRKRRHWVCSRRHLAWCSNSRVHLSPFRQHPKSVALVSARLLGGRLTRAEFETRPKMWAVVRCRILNSPLLALYFPRFSFSILRCSDYPNPCPLVLQTSNCTVSFSVLDIT